MTRFTELHPRLYRHELRRETVTRIVGDPLAWKQGDPTEEAMADREYYVPVGTLAEADGVMFDCPKCRDHKVMCWFYGKVADSVTPGPGRWAPRGSGLHDLTFVPNPRSDQTSVKLEGGGCGAHFNVVNGEVTGA